jgi:uncharacterized protein (DUF305 family)
MNLFSRAFVRKRVISLAATTSVIITSLALAQGSTPAEHIRYAAHHQGVVDMATAELSYVHNEELRRPARKIVANRQQEITLMRHAVDDEPSTSVGASNPPPVPHEMDRMSHDAAPHS